MAAAGLSAWNPSSYLRFGGARLRPALDLLERVPAGCVPEGGRVLDLGCGPGNLLPALLGKFPTAKLLGMDLSPEMIKAAAAVKAEHPSRHLDLMEGEIGKFDVRQVAGWEEGAHLIFSNAAIHWVPGQEALLKQLMAQLAPGGCLAVQVPDTRFQASHLLMKKAAENLGWGKDVEAVRIPRAEGGSRSYWQWLMATGLTEPDGVDVWETKYCQVLSGENPVPFYTRETGLKPIMAALDGEGTERANKFEEEYRRLCLEAYPPSPGGATLFPFTRLFFVAQRAA